MTPTVFIVDDDPAMRESLQQFLEVAGLKVEAFADGPSFLATCDNRPGCVVLDMAMPGMDGHAVQAALCERGLVIPVIFLTGHASIPQAVRTVRGGAVDFLEKPVTGAQLLERVRDALALDAQRRHGQDQFAELQRRYSLLSQREVEVLRLLVVGMKNKELARTLGISPRTVETHRAHIMYKMGATSLAELAQMAVHLHLDPPVRSSD
ncbi:MAG: response regulator [Candidatus Competibacteraceae bacterium]|jgi:two-component system response regulator FixJ|nr:response regulator [Candidatus Competibacteraceae bacterium]